MSPPAAPSPSTPSPVPRFAVYYAAVFAVVGVNLPFWPVWLQWRGLAPAEIGLVISAGVWL